MALMGKGLKICSLNVQGLKNPVKRKAILSLLEHSDSDICLLQETPLLSKDYSHMRDTRFPHQFWSSGPSKKKMVLQYCLVPFARVSW